MMNQFYKAFRENGSNRLMRLAGVKNSIFTFALMLLTSLTLTVMAQDLTVSGTVKGTDGTGLPGVTVQVKGTTKGTQTDLDGKYKLAGIPKNATLVFSSVGMTSQEVAVGNRSVVDVTLSDDSKTLEQVVVVGYGTQKVKDVTGSVASLGTKDFNKGIITTADQLLEGRVTGVSITPTSGEPGAAANVNIRGISTLASSSAPLYVIDGVPLTDANSQSTTVDAGAGANAPRNPLSFINPSDIENISVLKDASAAAIYGARGANGVILITTKKGKGGQGLTFSTQMGVSTIAKKYDLLSASDFLAGVTKTGGNATGIVNGGTSTDWQDQIFQSAFTQSYNLSYGGGNEDFRYRLSGGYQDQAGILKKTGLNRLTGRINLSKDFFHDKLVIDLAASVSQVHDQLGQTGSTGYQGNTIGAAIIMNPTYPVMNSSGGYSVVDNSTHNPVQMINLINDKDVVNRYLLNLSATYKITSSLSYKGSIGIDNSSTTRNTYMDPNLNGYANTIGVRGVNIEQVSGNGMAVVGTIDNHSFLVEHTLTYDKKMANSALNIVGGFSYQNFYNLTYNTIGYGKGSTFGTDLNGYKKRFSYGDSTKSELQSYFGRVNYSIADKYFFTGTVRIDGSSKFGTNNKYGTFPSFGFKYRLINEDFIPKDVFSDLGLRITWGQTGNSSLAPYQSQSIYQHNYNGSDNPINAANPNLKWETVTSYGAGLDFAILKGRIAGTVDYFNRNTTNLLFLSVYAQPAAVNQRWVNLPGSLNNTGAEVGLAIQLAQGKNFTWEMLPNITFMKTTMENVGSLFLPSGAINGQGLSGAYGEVVTNNAAPYSFYMPTFTGFDANGFSTYANGGKSTIVGSPFPTYQWGFTNNFTFGKWNASMFWNGQGGNYIYNNTANALFLAGSLKTAHNVTYSVYNSNEAGLNAGSVSSRFLEKGDFARLSNVTLGYTFDLAKGSAIKSLRVNLTGQNLVTITNYTGLNPQVSTPAGMNGLPSYGIDYAAYPVSRTFLLGLSASF